MKGRSWYHLVLCGLVVAVSLGMLPLRGTTLAQTPEAGLEVRSLYPEDLDPPEACGVGLGGSFGADEEVFLGPWHNEGGGFQLEQAPGWYDLELAYAGNCRSVAAAAMGTERIAEVIAKPGTGELFYSVWSANGDDADGSPGGWSPIASLGESADGNPALISRHARHWEVYARQGNQIKYRTWENGTLYGWQPVPGVDNAASDPAVVSVDPYHTVVFYRDADGIAWFSEWVGGGGAVKSSEVLDSTGIWRPNPVSFRTYRVYLPVAVRGSEGVRALGAEVSPAQAAGGGSVVTFASELAAASRNSNHIAVFGVSADGRLWVKEWTNVNAADWHDTHWVGLMEDVAIEKPAIASRHSNHLAVAVRDTSGEAHYIEWTPADGWKAAVPLGEGIDSPLTMAATSIDALSVFGVDGDQNIRQKAWTEAEGWGEWQTITDSGTIASQTLAAPVRRLDDVMLLGHTAALAHFYKHYTSQDRDVTAEQVMPGGMEGSPRGQVLAWVKGNTLWVTAHAAADGAHWEVEAFDMAGGLAGSLILDDHAYRSENYVSVAAGDVDLDGDDEVIVATNSYGDFVSNTQISVLELAVGDTVEISGVATAVDPALHAGDISVAMGDLDADGRQDEVVLAGPSWDGTHIVALEYVPATQGLELRFDSYASGAYYDLEVAVAHVHGSYKEDQVVLAGIPEGPYAGYFPVEVKTYRLDNSTWQLQFLQTVWQTLVTFTDQELGPYSIAMDTGDVDGDGLEEIACSYAMIVAAIDPEDWGFSPLQWEEGTEWDLDRSLAVADVDRDGRGEIVASFRDGTASHFFLVEVMNEGDLFISGEKSLDPTDAGTVLAGDLDGDTFMSELAGCATFTEASVVAVVNGVPRWYAGGEPIHDSLGSYSITEGGGSEEENGFSKKLGGSFSVGFGVETNVPIVGTKISEVRGSVTADFLKEQGVIESEEHLTIYGNSYLFEGTSNLGMVVYEGVDYTCYYYDVYPDESPEDRSRTMACRPAGGQYVAFKSLEDWHSEEWKDQAGVSWVDVGHKRPGGGLSNDLGEVGNYARSLPVDEFMLLFRWNPDDAIRVSYDSQGGLVQKWWAESMDTESRMEYRQSNVDCTLSMGVTVGVMTADASFTTGFGSQSSNTTSWQESLSFGGGVYKFQDPNRPCYEIVPYVVQGNAVTAAGTSYPYFEMDYYVPWIGPCGIMSEEEGGSRE